MTTPDMESVLLPCPFCQCVMHGASNGYAAHPIESPCLLSGQTFRVDKWNTRAESTELTRLRAELAEEKRKVTAMEVALAKWNNHFFWRQSPDEDGMHSIPTKIIQDCLAVTQFALAALTTPSEKG